MRDGARDGAREGEKEAESVGGRLGVCEGGEGEREGGGREIC